MRHSSFSPQMANFPSSSAIRAGVACRSSVVPHLNSFISVFSDITLFHLLNLHLSNSIHLHQTPFRFQAPQPASSQLTLEAQLSKPSRSHSSRNSYLSLGLPINSSQYVYPGPCQPPSLAARQGGKLLSVPDIM